MELQTDDRHDPWKAERVQTKLHNSEGGAEDKGVASQTIGTMQLKRENPLRRWSNRGNRPKGKSIKWWDHGSDQRKREQRRLGVVWNKELTWESRPEVDLYGTRSEGGVSKVTWIGNRVGIGNWSEIDQEWRWSLNCEGEGYTGVEGRQNEQDSNRKS